MRFKRSLVSGLETSGERGPSPPPCFGSHGAGAGGFCVLSGISRLYQSCRERQCAEECGARNEYFERRHADDGGAYRRSGLIPQSAFRDPRF
jgi:hypothetical protein